MVSGPGFDRGDGVARHAAIVGGTRLTAAYATITRMEDWGAFLAESIGAGRRSRLLEPIPASEALRSVLACDCRLKCIVDVGDAANVHEGEERQKWTFTPRGSCGLFALDQFFNGCQGYRAAYASGVSAGEAVNDELIQILTAWFARRGEFHGAPSKVWIKETRNTDAALRTGIVERVDIALPRWVRAAEDCVCVCEVRNGQDCWRYKAAAGVLAPEPKVLVVVGAWPNQVAKPAKPPDLRAQQLFDFGYT